MKSRKKIKTRKPRAVSKAPRRRRTKDVTASNIPLTYQRKLEEEFIGAHPEAFDPYVGEWVAMQGPAIVAHGHNFSAVAEEARARGAQVPYIFRVEPKRRPNEGYL
jgi:hypothetical protein